MELTALRQRVRQAAAEINVGEALPSTLFSGWHANQPPSKNRVSYTYEPKGGKSVADVIVEYFSPARTDDRGQLSVVIVWDQAMGDLGQRTQSKANQYWFMDSNGGAKYYGDDVPTGLAEARICVQALVGHLRAATEAAEESRELPSTWKRGRVQLVVGGGWKTIPNAWRLHSLAVHEALDGDGWAVSHAPSGRKLGAGLGDERVAKKAAEKLLKSFPGLESAMDIDAAVKAIQAGGGPGKVKAILNAARRSGPKAPWQTAWANDMKSALIAYDRKLEQREKSVNPHRIALLLEALGRVEDAMKKQGTEASIADLKSAVIEHFTAETMPEIKKLFKKWGEPWSPEDDRQVQVRDRKLFSSL